MNSNNVEESLKAIVGPGVSTHIKTLQDQGLGVLSQYSIGTPNAFGDGAVQLPITTLDNSGAVRLHLGNLAVVVRKGHIDGSEMEFLWFPEIGEYEGRDFAFYGQTSEEIETVNSALDTMTRVLGAVDAALNSKAADRLIANATSRGRAIQAHEIPTQVGRGGRQWGDRNVPVRGVRSVGSRKVYSGGRSQRIDVSQIETRPQNRVTARNGGANAPSTGNLKKDMEKFLASNDSPIWFKSNRVASARNKLRDWVVGQYVAECAKVDGHIPCHTFVQEWEPRMMGAGLLRPYCKFNTQTVPVERSETGVLLCNKESCSKWTARHGDCDELVLRIAEGY